MERLPDSGYASCPACGRPAQAVVVELVASAEEPLLRRVATYSHGTLRCRVEEGAA